MVRPTLVRVKTRTIRSVDVMRAKIEDAKNHQVLVLLKHYDISAFLTLISTKLHSRKMVQY